MVIEFASKRMQKACSSGKHMRKEWGDQMARKLQQRLTELEAAETLADVALLPSLRCHELGGDRKGQLAVDLVHPHRLVFVPAHDPPPTKADGGLDWAKVTGIVVVEVVDYH